MEPAGNIEGTLETRVITLDNGEKYAQVYASLPSEVGSSQDRAILYVCDCSGSMSGAREQFANDILNQLFQFNKTSLGRPQFPLITFNDKSALTFIPSSFENLDRKYVSAGGGTFFTGVLNRITELIPNDLGNVRRLSIVFLSDGEIQDNRDKADNYASLSKAFDGLTVALEKQYDSYDFHTIGVSAEHNPFLMERLTKLSSAQGTYFYLKQRDEVQNICDGIQSVIAEAQFVAFLSSRKGLFSPQKLVLSPAEGQAKEGQSSYEVLIPIVSELDDLELTIRCGNNAVLQKTLTPLANYVPSSSDKLVAGLASGKNKISKINQRIINGKKEMEELTTIVDEVSVIRREVQALGNSIFRVHPKMRTRFLEAFNSAKEAIDACDRLLNAAFQKKVDNDLIASVNALAYKDITKKSIKKQLEKRAQKTVQILNEAYKSVDEISTSIDTQALEKDYAPLVEEIGACAYSCLTFPEALKAGDCICITFDIGRTEDTIVAPNTAIIKEIHPTVLSAASFLDSVKYSLKLSPEASGGFDATKQGKVFTGVARENITGALPIFICPEHWRIARQLIKPVLGWVTTLDPIGFNYDQMKTIPFLLLLHSAVGMQDSKNPQAKFHKRVFELLRETCLAIMADDETPEVAGTMRADITEIYNGYVTNGEARLHDGLTNNGIFLMQLLCAFELKWVQPPENPSQFWADFFPKMIEEELRRKQVAVSVDWKVMGIEYTPLNELIQKYTKETLEECKTKEQAEFELDWRQIEFNFDELLPKTYEHQIFVNAKQTYEKSLRSDCGFLFVLWKYFDPTHESSEPSFSQIGINDDLTLLALYMQNQIHPKNRDRRKAFKESYKQPQTESKAFLKEFLQRHIQSEVKRSLIVQSNLNVKSKQKKHRNPLAYQNFNTFLNEADLDKAVEALKATNKSSRSWMFRLFSMLGGTNVAAKIEILIEGQYDGEWIHPKWIGNDFTPKNRYVRKLARRDPAIDKSHLNKILPHLNL
eukprot:TRINITY_DN518_c0_g2_i1.p1 TRINITY_DN518_c0_g2~~TRINITY_DN518_c0_g2_i1.p1  ORF type:complete len:991 (+),score=252.11 TRINITY_DN518_c0_g2_i1:133-3105(+)